MISNKNIAFRQLVLVFVYQCFGTSNSAVCKSGLRESDYRGCLDKDFNGNLCQKWSSQYPHRHDFYNIEDAGDHNFCRNPDPEHKLGAWCYLAKNDGGSGWAYCNVSVKHGTCRTTPSEDTNCPDSTRTSKKTTNIIVPNMPTITITVNEGSSRVQQCGSDCKEFKSRDQHWKGPTTSFYLLMNGSLLLLNVSSEKHAGTWTCFCRNTAKKQNYDVEVRQKEQPPTITKQQNEQNKLEENINNETMDNETGNAEARGSDSDCKGLSCGLCGRNPIVCSVTVSSIGIILVIVAVYARKSLNWKRISAGLITETTKSTSPSKNTAGSYTMRRLEEPHHYEKALKLEESLAKTQNTLTLDNTLGSHHTKTMESQPSEDGHHQSLTSTLFGYRPSLAQIKCDEICSRDDIICSVSGTESVSDTESVFQVFEADDTTKTLFETVPDPRIHTGRRIKGERTVGSMEGRYTKVMSEISGGTVKDVKSKAGRNKRSNKVPTRTYEEEIGHTISGVSVFDRYYDDQVDNWSIDSNYTIQI